MKEILNDWLERNAHQPGVLACGLSYPDKSTCTRAAAANFSNEALENAWRCLADTFQVLKHHRLPAVRLCWVYEHCYLHCATRPDGIFLALFTARKDVDAVEVNRLLSEFQSLGN